MKPTHLAALALALVATLAILHPVQGGRATSRALQQAVAAEGTIASPAQGDAKYLSWQRWADDDAISDVVGVFEGLLIHTVPEGIPDFHSRMLFFADGNWMETHQAYQTATPFGPVMVTPGLGTWAHLGENKYRVLIGQDAQGGPGNPTSEGKTFAINQLEWTPTFDRSTGSMEGSWTGKLYDTQGNFITESAGTLNVHKMPRASD